MRALLPLIVLVLSCAENAGPTAPPPPCEAACQDGIGIRAIRETMKLAYNLTLQGKPVGAQDATTPCPQGGTAHVFGTATSNGLQGTTDVDLTYELAGCAYLLQDEDADQNYATTITATIHQQGILAVQPSATSAVIIRSDRVELTGTVYNPPLPYTADCPIELGQNGNLLTGTLCDRKVRSDL